MKKRDFKDLKVKKIAELTKLVLEKKAELAKIAIGVKTQSEKNVKKGKMLKLEIVRLLTLIREKELLGEEKVEETKK
jgi:ribosomal protein L29